MYLGNFRQYLENDLFASNPKMCEYFKTYKWEKNWRTIFKHAVNGTEKSILNERKVTPIQKIFEELV
jgi:hypothetical protein